MIYLCDKCNSIAVWEYAPNGKYRFCEEHVPRGCSCQTDEDGNAILDPDGREQPCCEYDYNKKGFRVWQLHR